MDSELEKTTNDFGDFVIAEDLLGDVSSQLTAEDEARDKAEYEYEELAAGVESSVVTNITEKIQTIDTPAVEGHPPAEPRSALHVVLPHGGGSIIRNPA